MNPQGLQALAHVEAIRRRLKISWEAMWAGYVGRAIYERASLGLR